MSQVNIAMNPRTKDLLILTGICFLCFFWRLGSVGLFDFNEGFYTQAAREMYLRGDYITPRINGILFFDKPPLAIWLSALSFHVFGVNEFAARFPVALAATAIAFLTYLFGARFFGRRAGLLAGAMVALNPLVYGTARQMTMDIHQSLWFSVAMFSFFLARTKSRESRVESREGPEQPPSTLNPQLSTSLYYHGFWAACGLGVLAKSIPGFFPIVIAFVYVLFAERFQWRQILKSIWEARVLTGIPLMLLVIVPWFYLAWKANGRIFYEEFWLLHHVQLARGGDFNHAQPIWYYIPALVGGFFPWSLLLPWALAKPLKAESSGSSEERSAHLMVMVWAVLVFIIFSLMKSKLVSYLLPMYPAAALLAGIWLSRAIDDVRGSSGLRWATTVAAILALVGLVAGSVFAHHVLTSPSAARQRQDIPPDVIQFAIHGLIIGAAGTLAAAALTWTGRRRQGAATLIASTVVFIAFADVEGLNAMESKMNAPLQGLARDAGTRLKSGLPLAIHIGQPRRPSIFFYLPDSVFLGGIPRDNSQGIIVERGEKEPVEAFLNHTRPAYVLTDRERGAALMATNPGLRTEAQRDRWLLLRADPISANASEVSPQSPARLPAPRR